ncbi:MAG: hypothetical protein Q9182_007436 [Xanthomendoza sp. 2 TL-2023]
MKAFTISTTLALLASMVAATPVPAEASAAYQVGVTFLGAADGRFVQYFSTNGYGSPIYNPLSISKITNPGGATCTFYGINNSVTVVRGGQTVDVGPPQTQTYGYCTAY